MFSEAKIEKKNTVEIVEQILQMSVTILLAHGLAIHS
jgi:hypothetical protein